MDPLTHYFCLVLSSVPVMGWIVFPPPSKFICWSPDPLRPQNVIVFVGRTFKEVIKIKWDPTGGSKSNMTGVLIRRGSFRNCGWKWKTGSWHSKRGLRPIASLRPGSLLEPQNPRYNEPGSVILTKSSGRTSWIIGRVWHKMKMRIPRLKISKNFKTLAAGH